MLKVIDRLLLVDYDKQNVTYDQEDKQTVKLTDTHIKLLTKKGVINKNFRNVGQNAILRRYITKDVVESA